MGRKTKISESIVSKICTAIKLGCTVQLAAGYAGIHVRTLYFWLQRGQEDKTGQFRDFYTRYKEAEAIGAVNNLACINSAAKGGDWRAAAWILQTRHGFSQNAQQIDPLQEQVEAQQINVKELLEAVKEGQKELESIKEPGSKE
jgi:hypothetical protein